MTSTTKYFFSLLFLLIANIQLSAQGVGKVDFSSERGYYESPFSLSLSCDDPAATIRYTTNGTRPTTSNGVVYSTPINISTTYFIRAVAYNSTDTSSIETHTYIFLNDVITSPVMNTAVTNNATYAPQMRAALEALPSISIVTGNPNDSTLVTDYITVNEQETSVELLYLDGTPSFQIDAGIKESGNTVDFLAKRAYRLIFSKDYGPGKMEYPLFNDFSEGLEPVEEFDRLQLRGGSDDAMTATSGTANILYMRQRFMENVQLELGEISSHGRFMHMYVNGEYYGQWHLQERPDAHFHASYYGGDNCDFDVINKQVAVGSCPDANLDAWNTAFALRGTYASVKNYVDVENLANYALMNIWADGNSGGNEDVMYGRKRQADELFHFYCWDSDRIWYNVNSNSVSYFSGQGNPRGMFLALMDLHEDYRMLTADRAYCMFYNDGLLTPANNAARLQKLEAQIEASILGETARWGTLAKLQAWETRLDYMYNTYFPQRTDIVIGHLRAAGYYPSIDPPVFNVNGGTVPLGQQVQLTNPNISGTIYYTTDGSDPRDPGGAVSATAQTYSNALIIGLAGAVEVKARVLDNGEWSAMCPVAYYPPQNYSDVVINEINYNAGEACQAGYTGLDYIEIANGGTNPVDISGTKLSTGITYTFPVGTILSPNSYIVLAENKFNFELAYGFAPFGQYSGDLDNGGELLTYTNFDATVLVDTVHYDDIAPWPQDADGNGASLELINTALDNALPASWQASGNFCGSPGAANISNCTSPPATILFNEIDYNSTFPNTGDWLELYNPNSDAVDISAWELRDESNVYLFPNGTIIPAEGYLVVAQNTTLFTGVFPLITNYVGSIGFGFSDGGELLTLLSSTNCLVDQVKYNDDPPWVTDPDVGTSTLSLIDPTYDNDLPTSWVSSSQAGFNFGTPGEPNNITDPCMPTPENLVINEINYNPDSLNNSGDWIELYNPNSTTVDLSNWRVITENDGYKIPATTSIPADGYLVIAESVDLFVAMFPNVPNYIQGIGLGFDKAGEQVQLMSPTSCAVDSLTYDDSIPWDTIPDGNGPTLSLIDSASDNALSTSWENSSNIDAPYGTPGRANAPCPEIAILTGGLPCIDGEVIFEVDTLINGMTYDWSFPDGSPTASDEDSLSVIWTVAGTYTVQLTTNYFDCTNVYTINVTMTEFCNTPPNAVDDNFSVSEDSLLSKNVLLNDSDSENNPLIVSSIPQTVPENGTVDLHADGTFTYVPNPDFYGADSFVYEVCDSNIIETTIPTSFIASVVSGEDDVEEDAATGIISVSSGDLDLVEDPNTFIVGIRFTNITIPSGATITNAYLQFVADESQSVATSLSISAENTGNALPIIPVDSAVSSKIKTLASAAWNPAGWIIGSTYTTSDISTVISELVGRGDWQGGNAMTFIIEGSGTRTAESYEGGFAPELHIEYEAIASTVDVSLCKTATVNITIDPVNDAPIAENDSGTTDEDAVLSDNILLNDNDIENDVLILTTTPLIAPANGSVSLVSNGTYAYVPDLNFNGTDSFQYEVCDNGNPVLCDTAMVNISINGINDAPVATDATVDLLEDNVLNGTTALNNSDIENDNLTVNVMPVTVPSNGLLTLNADGTYTYTPDLNFNGTDSFEYEVCDDGNPTLCDTGIISITVEPVNDAPVAVLDETSTDEDLLINGTVASNDSDIDGVLTFTTTPVTPPANGALTLNADGSYTYTPNPNFNGTDSFEYEVCDDGNPALCDMAVVTITIHPVNDAPIAVDDTGAVNEDDILNSSLALNDDDIDGVLVYTTTPSTAPANGTVSIASDGSYAYTPNPNFNGTDSFEYEVCDDGSPVLCETATVSININAVNDPPFAVDDMLTILEDESITSIATTNDLNVDGDTQTLSTTPVVNVSNGSLFMLGNGFYAYTPNSNFAGTDSFQYEICDDGNPMLCDTATVILTVIPVNDAPVATIDSLIMTANATAQINIISNDSDIENDNLSASINPVIAPANGVLNIQANGEIDYTPDTDYFGLDEFSYEVCDDGTPAACDTARVVITVNADCVDIQLYALLQGAYDEATVGMQTMLNTQRGLLPGQTPTSNLVSPTPAGQPYNAPPWNYTGTEGETWTDAEYEAYPVDVVDWILVSYRTEISPDTELAEGAGLLHQDGSISFPNRCILPATSGLDSVYIIIEHRTHIGIMTPVKIPIVDNVLSYDFRLEDSYKDATSFGQKQLPSGEWGMYSGDGDQSDFPSYDISGPDKVLWFLTNGVFDTYLPADYNMDGDISGADKVIWSENNGISSRIPK